MLKLSEVKKIREDWLERWVAEDFLTKLYLEDNRTAVPPFSKDSVWNDNGVLFTVTMLQLLSNWDLQHSLRARFIGLLTELKWHGEYGVYQVSPGRTDNFNSHDNYIAIAAGSALYNMRFAGDIAMRGFKSGWRMKNGKVFIQPKDQCFIKMCAGIDPEYFEYAQMLLGFFVACFYPINKSSELLLTLVRKNGTYESHQNRIRIGKKSTFWNLAGLVSVFWYTVIDLRHGWENVFKEYYKEADHPARRLSKGL